MRQLMDPWHPITNAKDLKFLGKLAEECGELNAAIARCIIQGIDGTEPDTGKSNRERLEDEIADVLANLTLVRRHFDLGIERINERAELKRLRLKTWHDQA